MSSLGRIAVSMLETRTDRCTLVYGTAPCTASGGTGNECYNTYRTCQDKTNYTLGTKTRSFCTPGAPLPAGVQSRPYIKPTGLRVAPTVIDPRAGLAPRADVTITLTDEPCPDIDDPYILNRATPAGGTYWQRLLAREHNYSNRTALIRRAYFTGDWDDAEFVDEAYLIDSIKGPTSSGEVTITLKDPLKLTDRAKLPAPTGAKLGAVLLTSDLQATLAAGDGAKLPATGYFRVGEQIIRYTSNAGDVLSWPDSTYRSQFNTTAVEQSVGDAVQECLVIDNELFSETIRIICNASGIADASIDLVGNAADDAQWLGERYRVTACLSDPEEASTYLAELNKESGCVTWWDPVAQKVKTRYIGPQSPATVSGATLTDTANIIEGSVRVEPLDTLRLTYTGIFYELANATANRKEGKNFLRGQIAIDADAEGPNEYGDRRVDVMYSRWFTADNDLALQGFVSRRLGTYRDVPKNIILKVDPKDAAIREGDLYDVTTAQVVDEAGNPKTVRCLVVKRQDNGTGDIELTLRTTNFGRRYGFIAPNGTADYPVNDDYACICQNDGRFADGSSGYLII